MNAELLDRVYQGATESPPWRGLLQHLCELCRCQAVTFVLRMPRLGESGVLVSCNADKRYEKRYLTHFSHCTPFRALPLGLPRRLDELLPRDELVASDYYQLLLKPAATEHLLGMNLPGNAGAPSLLTLSRTRKQENFGELEREMLAGLAEHLGRALGIFQRFQDVAGQSAVFSDALDHLGIGAVILNREGQFLGGNRTALDLLQELGLPRFDADRLTGLLGARAERFKSMVQRCISAFEHQDVSVCEMMAVPAEGRRPSLHLLARPSVQRSAIENSSTPAVCIFVSLPGRVAVPSAEMVRELFGFSRAESAVVCLLLGGRTAKEIAFDLNVSLSTVRTHIKSVFAKAGVGRQSELVASVLRSIALLA